MPKIMKDFLDKAKALGVEFTDVQYSFMHKMTSIVMSVPGVYGAVVGLDGDQHRYRIVYSCPVPEDTIAIVNALSPHIIGCHVMLWNREYLKSVTLHGTVSI